MSIFHQIIPDVQTAALSIRKLMIVHVRKVSANTVKHRHANIHKALSYAYKTDLIQTNPADKVELPTIDKFVGHFYNAAQLEEMFKIFKGDPAEFGVIAASFYGLRRSEVLGLRWDAIDFEEKTITIRHTVNETRIDGKYTLVLADTTKTKSSYRTLSLVAPFEAILKRMKAEQEENRKLCGNCYCQDYLGYIYVNELGELIKLAYLQHVLVELPYLGKNQSHEELESFMPWAPYIQQEFGVKNSDAYVNTYLD